MSDLHPYLHQTQPLVTGVEIPMGIHMDKGMVAQVELSHTALLKVVGLNPQVAKTL